MNKDNQRKHILYIHNKTEISGGEQSLLNLWENLNKEQFKPYLLIPDRGPFAKRAKEMQIECIFYQMPKLSPLHIFKIIKAISFVHKLLKKHDITLIHSYTPRNNIIGALAAKLSSTPIIWHERNMIYGNERDISKSFSFLADAIICNSHAVRKRFNNNKKVHVIHNGVNTARFTPVESTTPFKASINRDFIHKTVIGLIGNLNERKRPEFCLQIAQHFKGKPNAPIFLIVGSGFSKEGEGADEKLKYLAQKLGVNDMIKFSGFSDDIAETLKCIDVIIHTTKKEACSRVILEAMASGKPVIALNDGGNPELIENQINGFLVEPDDHDRFAQIIEHLMETKRERLLIGGAARMRIENCFTIQQNTKATEELYTKLLKRRNT